MMSPSPNEYPDRSPKGTAMLAGLTGKQIARRAGSGAAERSAQRKHPCD